MKLYDSHIIFIFDTVWIYNLYWLGFSIMVRTVMHMHCILFFTFWNILCYKIENTPIFLFVCNFLTHLWECLHVFKTIPLSDACLHISSAIYVALSIFSHIYLDEEKSYSLNVVWVFSLLLLLGVKIRNWFLKWINYFIFHIQG